MIGRHLLVFIIVVTSLLSDDSIEISLSENRIYYGDSVRLSIKVHDGDSSTTINTDSLLKNFQVLPLGERDISSSSIQIINGEITREVFRGYLFVYSLTPKSKGTFDIGPLEVTLQGKKLLSERITLYVAEADKGNQAFLKIHSTRESYVIGETFTIAADVYIKQLTGNLKNHDPIFPDDCPTLNIPWLQKEIPGLKSQDWKEVLRSQLADFTQPGFYVNDTQVRVLPKKEVVSATSPSGETAQYIKYTISQSFEATSVGEYSFGPAFLKGMVAAKSLGGGRAEAKKVIVNTAPVVIKIRDVPQENRPQYYNGAIGTFTISAHLLSSKAHVGDLLDLIVTVRGEGQVENLVAPKLSQQSQINEFFKVYDDNVSTESGEGSKKFQYSVRVKNVRNNFPKIYFSYFDPKTASYHTLSTKEIPLQIQKAHNVLPEEIVQAEKGKNENNIVEGVDQGIFANYEGLDVLNTQHLGIVLWQKIIFFLLPALYILVLLRIIYLKKWGDDVAFQRKRKALSRAKQRLEASCSLSGEERYTAKLDAIKGYVADYFNLHEHGLVANELLETVDKKISVDTYEKLSQFLELCESVRYGVADVNSDVDKSSMDLLTSLSNELSR